MWRSVAISFGLLAIASADANAICRMVVQQGSVPPAVSPAQSVLLVKQHNVPVGPGCPPAPPTTFSDGGPDDASLPPMFDLSTSQDLLSPPTSSPDLASSTTDLGHTDGDASTCHDRLGDAITMVVQPSFSTGPTGSSFAFLMVTPNIPLVTLAPKTLFQELAAATAPLVKTEERDVEDPSLGYQCNDPKFASSSSGGGCGNFSLGSQGGSYHPPTPTGTESDAGLPDGPFTLGSYQVAVLAGADLPAIQGWLDGHQYAYGSDDLDALQPYVDLGWTVVAVRVRTDLQVVAAALDPLAFTWEGSQVRVPIAVSRDQSSVPVPVTVYVAAEGHYEFAHAKVPFAQWTHVGGGDFLTRNDLSLSFNTTLELDPIAVRQFGDPTARDTITVTTIVRIPSSQCPNSAKSTNSSGFCGCRLGGGGDAGRELPGTLVLLLGALAVLARRRQRAQAANRTRR